MPSKRVPTPTSAAKTLVLPGHFSDEDVRPLPTTLGDLEERDDLFGMDDCKAFVETTAESLSDEPENYNQIKDQLGKEPLTDEATDQKLGLNNCAAN